MALQSLNYISITLNSSESSTPLFNNYTLKDLSLEEDTLIYGWGKEGDNTEIYAIHEGLNDSLFTLNPSKLWTIKFALVPGSDDALKCEAWIKKVKTESTQFSLKATVTNTQDNSTYTSDEAYMVGSTARVYSKSPGAQIITLTLNQCVATVPQTKATTAPATV